MEFLIINIAALLSLGLLLLTLYEDSKPETVHESSIIDIYGLGVEDRPDQPLKFYEEGLSYRYHRGIPSSFYYINPWNRLTDVYKDYKIGVI